MVKLIHCADLHLGRVQNHLEQRFQDFGDAFRYVADEALARRVDFLLVSGDLFDKRNINARTLEQAVEILEPLREAGIRVIAIEGNHDKAFLRDRDSWMSFLAHRGYIVLLNPEFTGGKMQIEAYDPETCRGCYIDLTENLRVYGLGYLGRAAGQRLRELAEVLSEEKTNIVLLHALVGRMGGELIGSISKGDVICLRERVTYLALGHGHNRYVVAKPGAEENSDALPDVGEEVAAAAEVQSLQLSLFEPAEEVIPAGTDYTAYWGHNPGSLEHCRLDEAEYQQGFFYIELEDKKVITAEHIPSRQRPARIVAADITGSQEPGEAYERIFAAVRQQAGKERELLLRVVVKGEIGFDILEIDEEWIRAGIAEICAPLILEVDVRANLPQFTAVGETDLLDRQSIEREVLRRKVEDRALWRHLGDDLVNLILEIKDDVINGLPAEEVAAKVWQMAGDRDENS